MKPKLNQHPEPHPAQPEREGYFVFLHKFCGAKLHARTQKS
jgi:hypothetical protein